MDKYTVKFYKRAIRDIESVYAYIAIEKLSPENAKGQADPIKKAILDLDTMPKSHQDRLVGRYAGRGYKQLLVDNYVVIIVFCRERGFVLFRIFPLNVDFPYQ